MFDADAISLLISLSVFLFSVALSLLHTYCTHTHAKRYVFETDLHFSLRQFACLASKWTCLTLHMYMMTNPTSNLLCLFAVRTNFFHLINDHALKATKC